MLRVVTDDESRAEVRSAIDEICAEGARRMLAAALEAEVDGYITALAEERDAAGRRLVVRNGHAEPRTITTGAGAIEVEAPRVNDQRVDPDTGERQRFRSSILTPGCRKSPRVTEVLPLLYLHGLSSGDFAPALTEFFGSGAGLSASVITRLTTQWQADQEPSPSVASTTGTTGSSGPRPWPRSSTTSRPCWPSTTSRPSTGST